MGTFYDVDGGFGEMDQVELDRTALSGRALDSIGYGYACTGYPAPRHGYEIVWTNRQGMGNHGTAYLRGLTPRTKRLVWLGKRARVMRQHGCTEAMAAAILRAKSGTERPVVDLALRTCHDGAWATYPGVGGGVWRWAERECFDAEGLSAPRLDRACTIAGALRAVI